MKVLLYSHQQDKLKRSGIGRAFYHQKKALDLNNVQYTTNVNDEYDLVHINMAPASVIKKFRKKYPVIVHGHSTVEDFRRSFRFWRFIAPFFRKHLQNIYGIADLIITPTKYSKFLIESMPVIKCPVLAISNGIDLDEYQHNEEYINDFRNKFNVKENDKIVVGVGLLFERKGLHDFIEVARRLPDHRFIWFGHLNPSATTHFIRKAIKNRPSNVEMAGYVEGNIIKGAFQDCKCVFFPSYEETEGIVVLEALASKTPVIIRDIPVYYNWLLDQKQVLKGNNNREFTVMIKNLRKYNLKLLETEGYKVVEERSLKIIGNDLKNAYIKVLKIANNK